MLKHADIFGPVRPGSVLAQLAAYANSRSIKCPPEADKTVRDITPEEMTVSILPVGTLHTSRSGPVAKTQMSQQEQLAPEQQPP